MWSNLFTYWNNLLSNMAPILRDFTKSFQGTDWYLHLSLVSWAINLRFSFNCISYKFWLPERFPEIYVSFLNEDFVVRHSSSDNSAVITDQPLDKAHNKPAKLSPDIIGFAQRKEGGRLEVELNKSWGSKIWKLHECCLSNGWGFLVQPALYFGIGSPKQTKIASQP